MSECKYFLDTNIFLRLLMKDDVAKQKNCAELISLIKKGKLVCITSSLVLAEIVWTSLRSYKLSKPEVINIIKSITSLKNLKIEQDYDIVLATEYFEQYTMKFIDACLVTHNCFKDNNTVMVSYDKEFDLLAIKRMEPKQIINKL